jgi:ATP-dependent DNA helicase PIF1
MRGIPGWKANNVFSIMDIRRSVFGLRRNTLFTGEPGVGKSWVLDALIKEAKRRGLRYAVCASTVAAAKLLPEGKTFHSTFGVPMFHKSLQATREAVMASQRTQWRLRDLLGKLDLVFVDEAGMVGLGVFERADYHARVARGRMNEPFGGIRMVMAADFMQLKPVGDRLLCTSNLWKEMNMNIHILEHVYRQSSDRQFLSLLKRARFANLTESDHNVMRSRVRHSGDLDADFVAERRAAATAAAGQSAETVARTHLEAHRIFLFATHKQMEEMNNRRFDLIEDDAWAIRAEDVVYERVVTEGGRVARYVRRADARVPPVPLDSFIADKQDAEDLEYRLPASLQVKDGAVYVLTENVNPGKGLTRGTFVYYHRGEVVSDTGFYALVGSGRDRRILRCTEEMLTRKRKVRLSNQGCDAVGVHSAYMGRSQLALRMGFACTIHSSQGATFDKMVAHLDGKVCAAGQAYVAISRCRSLEGLWLSSYSEKTLRVDQAAAEYFLGVVAENERRLARIRRLFGGEPPQAGARPPPKRAAGPAAHPAPPPKRPRAEAPAAEPAPERPRAAAQAAEPAPNRPRAADPAAHHILPRPRAEAGPAPKREVPYIVLD